MRMVRIDSIREYIEFAVGLNSYGEHIPNEFIDASEVDESGIHAADKFVHLSWEDLEKYFGIYQDEEKNEEKTYFYIDGGGNEEKIRIYVDQEQFPKKEDFPIILTYHFSDSFDRLGESKERIFFWESLEKIQSSHDENEKLFLAKRKEIWIPKRDEWLKFYKCMKFYKKHEKQLEEKSEKEEK